MAKRAKKQTATHKYCVDQQVVFIETKDVFENSIVIFQFKNGEKSSMTSKRFFEMFEVDK